MSEEKENKDPDLALLEKHCADRIIATKHVGNDTVTEAKDEANELAKLLTDLLRALKPYRKANEPSRPAS